MVQYNPIDDYASTANKKKMGYASIPLLIHANFPKFNLATIFELSGPVITDNRGYTCAWTALEDVVESLGTDLEHQFWSEIRWTACTREGRLIGWKGQTGICEQVEDCYSTMILDNLYGFERERERERERESMLPRRNDFFCLETPKENISVNSGWDSYNLLHISDYKRTNTNKKPPLSRLIIL